MPDEPNLSIIIVNWNSANFLSKCLASIYVNTKSISFEVLVVDNASFDGCGKMIRKEFPAVRFIQSEENLGFARANNLAFTHSNGEVLLFLNPDTEVVGTALQDMMTCLKSRADAGVVGPQLLNSDFSIQTSCVRSFPSILNRILDSDYLRAKFRKSSLWGNRVLFEARRDSVPVEAISGACLMIRRSVFETVGHFSSEYFMYAEDTDLCYRVQMSGWKNYYAGGATVIHHGGQSSNSQPENQFSSLMMKESSFKFLRTHRGVLYASLFRSAMALAALCRLSLLAVAMVLPLGVLRRHSLYVAFAKWVRILRWALGLETWVKQFPNVESLSK
jgi:hypothetical protein